MRALRSMRMIVMYLSALALFAAAAAAQPARVSGQVRQVGSTAAVAKAQVKVEGPALAGRENSQVIRRANADGRYQLDLPAGTYFVEVAIDVDGVHAGPPLATDLFYDLLITSESQFTFQPPVPEPATIVLAALPIAALFFRRRTYR